LIAMSEVKKIATNNGRIETWTVDKFSVFLYSEDYLLAKQLRMEFKVGTVYFQNGRPIAWQFLIPLRILPLIVKKLGVDFVKVR
jgi:hypothetical protein